jgi:hypothetical protein
MAFFVDFRTGLQKDLTVVDMCELAQTMRGSTDYLWR